MRNNNVPYSVLATFYDKLISGYPYEKATSKILSEIKGKGIDLGTGSGKFAIEISKKGHAVVGVDSSSQMLEIARENAKKAGVKPIFAQNDIANLEFSRIDFVMAMCDVFNYLPSIREFEKVATKVYNALSCGGKFIFDISSEYKLLKMANEQYFEDRDDITYLWCNSLVRKKLVMSIAYFIPQDGDNYIRRDETHEMSVYKTEELVSVLQNIGFKVKLFGDKLTKLTENSQRVFFFCEK